MTDIPGLTLIKEAITLKQEADTTTDIETCECPWTRATTNRFVKQFGYNYGYAKQPITKSKHAIPAEMMKLVAPYLKSKEDPDQIIVNKYNPGQGIAFHTDHVKYFGD